MYIFESNGYRYTTTAFYDAYGNVYSSGHNYTYKNDYSIHVLNNEFATFTGSFVQNLDPTTTAMISIYADNVLIWQCTMDKYSEKIDFSVDLKNAKLLKIEVSGKDYDELYLINAQVKR